MLVSPILSLTMIQKSQTLNLFFHSLISFRWGVDSFRFNPDRLNLIENCKDIRFFTTFSSGAHICPGRHLAVIVSHAAFLASYPPLPCRLLD